ncbi:MAG: DUF4340 domain-containing protein [Chthoniobacterales bacterium]
MNVRYTIALACLALILFGLLIFLKPYIGSTKDRERMGNYVTNFDIEEVKSFTIKRGEEEIRFEKTPTGWLLEDENGADQASAAAVQSILTLTQDLAFLDVIRGAEFDAHFFSRDFGLSNPRQFLKIDFKDRKSLELLFGREGPEKNRIFVRRGDSKDTFLVEDELLRAITFSKDAYRDRQLASLPSELVNRIRIRRPSGEIILERDSGRWKITKPLSAEADQKRIEDALKKFLTAPVLEFLGSEEYWSKSVNANNISPSEIRLWSEGSQEPAIFRLLSEKELQGTELPDYLIYSMPRKTTMRIAGAPLGLSRVSLNQLREASVFQLNLDVIDRIGFRIGDKNTRLHRTENGWNDMKGNLNPEATEEAVKNLLTGLHEAKVHRFLTLDHTESRDLGLAEPLAEIRFNAWLSENTAEATAGEYPVSDLIFTRGQTGAWFVRVDKRAEVCEVSEGTFKLVKEFAKSLGIIVPDGLGTRSEPEKNASETKIRD